MTTVWVFVWYQGLLVGLVSSEFLSLVSIIKRESLLSEENRREENTQLRARSRHTQLAKHRAHRHTHIYIYIFGYLTANTGTNVPSFDAQPGAGKKPASTVLPKQSSSNCLFQTQTHPLPVPPLVFLHHLPGFLFGETGCWSAAVTSFGRERSQPLLT